MDLTHCGHAAVLVEIADQRILIDPGTFSDAWTSLRDLDAIVVTHQHPDHLDVDRLPELLRANAQAQLIVDPGSADVLREKGIEALAQDGTERQVGGVRLTPVGETHALIHPDIPRIPNVGVRLQAEGEPVLYHPGDSLEGEAGEVDVLLFPLNAPWQPSREMTGFLRRYDAPHAVPIHDGLLNERGRTLYLTQAGDLGGEHTRIHDLAGERTETFTA